MCLREYLPLYSLFIYIVYYIYLEARTNQFQFKLVKNKIKL